HRARIWVEQAERDLAIGLDPGQQASQPAPVAQAAEALSSDPAPGDDSLVRRRRADAERATYEAEAARRRLAVDEGRWLDAAEARRAWAQELAKLITEIEVWLGNTLAHELAAQFGGDWKAQASAIRAAWRAHRGTIADGAEAEVAQREAAPPPRQVTG
ncbi:MAG: hypothetical protein VW338_14125, partial [Rhodospirillaceae bacterium]